MKLVSFWLWASLCAFSGTALAKINVEVQAIEFPPYTTSELATDGIAFETLRSHPAMSEIEVTAKYSPPTRIGKRLLLRDWCMSFYPPRDQNADHFKKWVISEENINLGFYRLRQDSEFTWSDLSELEGYSVAILNSFSKKGLSGVLYDNLMDVHELESLDQGFDLLIKNRVDLVFSDKYSGQYIAIEHGYDLQALQFSDSALAIEQFHVWVNLNCRTLVEHLKPYW